MIHSMISMASIGFNMFVMPMVGQYASYSGSWMVDGKFYVGSYTQTIVSIDEAQDMMTVKTYIKLSDGSEFEELDENRLNKFDSDDLLQNCTAFGGIEEHVSVIYGNMPSCRLNMEEFKPGDWTGFAWFGNVPVYNAVKVSMQSKTSSDMAELELTGMGL